MIKFTTRMRLVEISMVVITILLIANLYMSYRARGNMVMINLNQVIGALANDIAAKTKDPLEQQTKTHQMVKKLEQHLVDLPEGLTVFNAGSIIKPGKLQDYSEQLLADVRANAAK